MPSLIDTCTVARLKAPAMIVYDIYCFVQSREAFTAKGNKHTHTHTHTHTQRSTDDEYVFDALNFRCNIIKVIFI